MTWMDDSAQGGRGGGRHGYVSDSLVLFNENGFRFVRRT